MSRLKGAGYGVFELLERCLRLGQRETKPDEKTELRATKSLTGADNVCLTCIPSHCHMSRHEMNLK